MAGAQAARQLQGCGEPAAGAAPGAAGTGTAEPAAAAAEVVLRASGPGGGRARRGQLMPTTSAGLPAPPLPG